MGVRIDYENGLDLVFLLEQQQSQWRVCVDAKSTSTFAASVVVSASMVYCKTSLQGQAAGQNRAPSRPTHGAEHSPINEPRRQILESGHFQNLSQHASVS